MDPKSPLPLEEEQRGASAEGVSGAAAEGAMPFPAAMPLPLEEEQRRSEESSSKEESSQE
jgi:hypothetical protein